MNKDFTAPASPVSHPRRLYLLDTPVTASQKEIARLVWLWEDEIALDNVILFNLLEEVAKGPGENLT